MRSSETLELGADPAAQRLIRPGSARPGNAVRAPARRELTVPQCDPPGRRSATKLLTRDEAFLLALNFAKLPMVPSHIMKEIPRQRHSAGRDGGEGSKRGGMPCRVLISACLMMMAC